ncbi:MAG: site-2 protease family protein [Oscillospiraceae bacterium]|jgi:Zn-dependent protease|nr:site-2 protease family protein [Oscillospiraceae bacterium]
MLEFLRDDPARFFDYALYRIPAVLFALVLHEWAHGYVAYRLGDPTAKDMGRLTLNPIPHLDPWGAVLMLFMGFGWAKPVPINPRNFANPRRDDLLVSIAGVTMNLILFLAFMTLAVAADRALWLPEVFEQSTLMDRLSFQGEILPYLLTGYGDYFVEWYTRPAMLPVLRITAQIAMVNLTIAIFNLIPLPPLDGSHVLNDLVIKRGLFVRPAVARAGMLALMVLSFTGWLSRGISIATAVVQSGFFRLLGVFGV